MRRLLVLTALRFAIAAHADKTMLNNGLDPSNLFTMPLGAYSPEST